VRKEEGLITLKYGTKTGGGKKGGSRNGCERGPGFSWSSVSAGLETTQKAQKVRVGPEDKIPTEKPREVCGKAGGKTNGKEQSQRTFPGSDEAKTVVKRREAIKKKYCLLITPPNAGGKYL